MYIFSQCVLFLFIYIRPINQRALFGDVNIFRITNDHVCPSFSFTQVALCAIFKSFRNGNGAPNFLFCLLTPSTLEICDKSFIIICLFALATSHDIIVVNFGCCSLISIKEKNKKKLVEKIPHGRENDEIKIPFYPQLVFLKKLM